MNNCIISLPKFLNSESLSDIESQIKIIAASQTKFIVVKGQCDDFCQGLDFHWLATMDAQELSAQANKFINLLDFLYAFPLITIAAVSGEVIGGGIGIASACDIVIAPEDSCFQITEGLFGLVPGIIMPYLLLRMPLYKIKQWLFTSEKLTSKKAYELGIVDDICSDATDLDPCIAMWIKKMKRCHPESIRDIKQLTSIYHDPQIMRESAESGIRLLCKQLQNSVIRKKIDDFIDYGIAPWSASGDDQ